MLESGKPASPQVVKHIDRCLSCLSCMTTCPSGVHYMHLVDHAAPISRKTHRRPCTTGCCGDCSRASCPIRTVSARDLGTRREALGAWWGAAGGGNARGHARLAPPPRRRARPRQAGTSSQGPAGGASPCCGLRAIRCCARLQRAASAAQPPRVEVVQEGGGLLRRAVHHMGATSRPALAAHIDVWAAELDAGLDAIVITASAAARRSRIMASCSATSPLMPKRPVACRRPQRISSNTCSRWA
jgi:glycolate oxidase iron-sulfur subunit